MPQGDQRNRAAVILAAGRSTRMKTELPKVMHEVCGRPMLAYVLAACREAGIDSFYVVVGFGKDDVIDAFQYEPGIHFVEQREQKGTGHAVSMCADALKDFCGDVIVIAGDMPMIRAGTLDALIADHQEAGAAISLATTVLDDPTSYGRIVRDADGAFEKIVEHKDCNPEQLAICEVNPSYYCFDAETLFAALPQVKANNAKGEYYITDVLEIVRRQGRIVRAAVKAPAADAVGINSRVDLADVAKLMQRRIQDAWMASGVSILSPDNTWVDARVEIGPETVIKPFSCLEGNVRVGRGCMVGPYAYLTDGAIVPDGASVGPGVLHAFDTTVSSDRINPMRARGERAVRCPPSKSGCSSGSESC